MRFTTFACFAALSLAPTARADTGTLVVAIRGADGTPLPSRLHLFDAEGKTMPVPGLPFWHDHVATNGDLRVELPTGLYRFEIERGPEYAAASGETTVQPGQTAEVKVTLTRFIDLADRGWYSGDLHVHRPPADIPPLLDAEALDLAGVITWWNDRNFWSTPEAASFGSRRLLTIEGRAIDLTGGEDEREGGALLYFGLDAPLDLSRVKSRELPSPVDFLGEARRANPDIHVDIEKPFWWDAPTWAAFQQAATLGLAHNHLQRSGVLDNEAWGRPRDPDAYPPGPEGVGRYTLDLYSAFLETGLRLPPSAGSASGVLPNPVGYNRAYVQLDGPFDPTAWWQGLRDGRSFVTNGPLLLVRADGNLPGHIFRAEANTPLSIPLVIEAWSRDPIATIEVVQNGRVVQSFGPGSTKPPGPIERSAVLGFEQSGWFLVRAISAVDHTFRFASTAPSYVEIGDEPRISRSACDTFRRWVEERMVRIEKSVENPDERRAILGPHEQALRFWEDRQSQATVE